jgi:hypothetical protein
MSTLLTRGPGVGRVREGDCRPRLGSDAGPTLDDVISRAWEVLRAGLPATCPACGGELDPRPSGAAGGRCESCGATLS